MGWPGEARSAANFARGPRTWYNGPNALAAVATDRPAVLLLDIGMPGTDDDDVARWIRQQAAAGDVTLIALTRWGQEADRAHSKTAGLDYHRIKPADVRVLGMLLDSLEGRSESRRASG